MSTADRLTQYVVQGIQDEGGWPSKVKVLKILYLIDLEYYRWHKITLTGWHWIFYHYGPWTQEFDPALQRLGVGDLKELEEQIDKSSARAYRYESLTEVSIEEVVSAGADQDRIDRIIRRWALEDTKVLLDHVYFYTEPMQAARRRGDALDFSGVQRQCAEAALPKAPRLPPEESQRKRDSTRERVRTHEKQVAKTQTLMQRYWSATSRDAEPVGKPVEKSRLPDLADGASIVAEPVDE